MRGMSIVLTGEKYWISPYAFSCFVALREKGIPFEVRTLSLGDGEQRAPEHATKSLTGRVPTLDHDGFVLAESSAILEYLEETFPTPRLYPSAPRDRARARQLMSWLRSDDTGPIREARSAETIFFERPTSPLAPKAAAAASKLFAVAERFLAPGAKTLFADFAIVDAELAFMLQRLVKSGDEVPQRLRDYAAAQWSRPSIRAWAEQPRAPYVPYG